MGVAFTFFHRTMNAYSTGKQKRQNTQHHGSTKDHVRWHKTGKTKAVIEYGVHKGYKKILVLYIRSGKESKSYKSDWKMHQYHPGNDEDEKNGEYVFSKEIQKLFPASQSHANFAFLLAAAARSSGWSISATMLPETGEETQVLTYESKLAMYAKSY
ncbi:hypothetical protein KIW84_065835 [Lathyrus oleraceus]|uniref:NAC domain-containing protein n=1 Tax=Pisum sativum TaxID=3888 RepID=A0A9D5A7X4_PEA|nr:hypothetical protein KIW84_065835 [Pisum sativum]